MKLVSTYPRLIAMSALFALGVCITSAQSYYDDDIYYDPSKVKKEKPVQQKKQTPVRQQSDRNAIATQLYYDGAQYVPWSNVGEYQSADSYQPTGTSTRDVDEYNRRYSSTSDQNAARQNDSISLQQFVDMSNTRKLARFQNSDVAAQAVGADEVYYDDLGNPIYADNGTYTSSQPSTTINLNVVGGYPYYGYYGYNSPWYWSSWDYDPWWGGYYRPYWSWGPSWSWSWGWGPSWSWGPSWNWGPSWGWGGPHWGHHHWAYYRPQSSPGAYRPNTTARNSGAIGSGRYSTGNSTNYRYTGGNRNNATTRPATQSVNSTNRPGYRVPLGTPSTSGSNATRYGTRGRTSSGSFSTPANNNRGSYNTPTNNSYRNHNNSGSYRNQSSGSFGGSRGGFSSGGSHGGHSGASGGGGGRRGR